MVLCYRKQIWLQKWSCKSNAFIYKWSINCVAPFCHLLLRSFEKDWQYSKFNISVPGLESRFSTNSHQPRWTLPSWTSNFTLSTLYSLVQGWYVSSRQPKWYSTSSIFSYDESQDPKNAFVQNGILKTYLQNNTAYSFLRALYFNFENKQFVGRTAIWKRHYSFIIFKSRKRNWKFSSCCSWNNGKTPAIFVDATSISSQHVFIWTPNNGDLVAPALMNVSISIELSRIKIQHHLEATDKWTMHFYVTTEIKTFRSSYAYRISLIRILSLFNASVEALLNSSMPETTNLKK